MSAATKSSTVSMDSSTTQTEDVAVEKPSPKRELFRISSLRLVKKILQLHVEGIPSSNFSIGFLFSPLPSALFVG